MLNLVHRLIAAAVLLTTPLTHAAEEPTRVPMMSKGAGTYYVKGAIQGLGPIDLMVDTGSGYLTINQNALEVLLREERARYVKKLRGVLADGSSLVVPVYALDEFTIGETCRFRSVEAAVFPGDTRFILGLSALTRAAPFTFAVDPPSLTLGNCQTTG